MRAVINRATLLEAAGLDCESIFTANGGEMYLVKIAGKSVLYIPEYLWDRIHHDASLTKWQVEIISNLASDMRGLGADQYGYLAGLLFAYNQA